MFGKAIKEVSKYTKPIYFVERTYIDNILTNGSATMFFVNEEGYALTCKHVAMAFLDSINLNNNYQDFKKRINAEGKLALETTFGYEKGKVVQRIFHFQGVNAKPISFSFMMHPKYDLALIKFNDFESLNYQGYATFIDDDSSILQGDFVCKVGYPFPEFNNFNYDKENDEIVFNHLGRMSTPLFPYEGMVTRFVADDERVFAIETSTPGLRGQSGGPLINQDGLVIGMQSMTKHLHLGFDIENTQIKTANGEKNISSYQFINLGHSIHVKIIKEFLKENNVKFYVK